ncbi:MAG TPA: hypothetical protein VFZ67_08005 [Nitrososphaera sp.]|nr:hypothetical protein [Nitrososphaera sp.]
MRLKNSSDCLSCHVVAKNEPFALTVLGGSVEAPLRRDFQFAYKTVDTAENIQTIEDDVMTAIERDRCMTQVTSSYL